MKPGPLKGSRGRYKDAPILDTYLLVHQVVKAKGCHRSTVVRAVRRGDLNGYLDPFGRTGLMRVRNDDKYLLWYPRQHIRKAV